MRILIISDLHIGPEARCASLIPDVERSSDDIDDEYIKHFQEFNSKLDTPIDYIMICGDITNSATPEQFEHFDIIIHELLDITGLGPERVFFTAGNHDYDWSLLVAEGEHISEEAWENRYIPLYRSNHLKNRINDAEGELTNTPYCCRWTDDNVYVLSINTAAHEKPGDNVRSGYISQEMLASIRNQLNDDQINIADKTKILLMHHHPVLYSNLTPTWKDFSAIQCHENMVEVASECGFDFIIHGHRHQPKFKSELSINGDQITIIASGSFSAKFPYNTYDLVSNQIHILDIDERDGDSGVMKGTVYNYAFRHTQGWKDSRCDGDGIDHRISFGPNEHKNKLYSIAKPYIEEAIETNSKCKVSDLISDNHEFQYKNDEIVRSVVEKICCELNYEAFGDDIHNTVILEMEDV